jgi:hypothetical protein
MIRSWRADSSASTPPPAADTPALQSALAKHRGATDAP